MSEWKPIETAPELGDYLVYLPLERSKVEVCHARQGANCIIKIIGGQFAFDRSAPTHWAPVPDEPIT